MNIFDKKIGIWGFGVGGKSILNYLDSNKVKISVLEKRILNNEENKFLKEKNISVYNQNHQLTNFFEDNDYIIPSPGIDLNLYKQFSSKWICELDIFSAHFKKPIVAVTGTVGKTTVTHLISELLNKKNKLCISAGNIGRGMCDLISMQDNIDYVALEVSSFQLEFCKLFSPDLAIWTNFYPNHLDRHGDMDSYFEAKCKIFSNEFSVNKIKNILLPFELNKKVYKYFEKPNLNFNFFSIKKLSDVDLKKIPSTYSIFFIENNLIKKLKNGIEENIIELENLPKITYQENWLTIVSALNLININLNQNQNEDLIDLVVPEHRLEKFISFKNIDFYNDSKSTIPDATMAAVNKLQARPIILFLGGISKGVDRTVLIRELKNKVKFIICFGKEADILGEACKINNIDSYVCQDLNEAVLHCFEIMQENDQILFSPSGASYDLFTNYQERGKKFKELVKELISKYTVIDDTVYKKINNPARPELVEGNEHIINK